MLWPLGSAQSAGRVARRDPTRDTDHTHAHSRSPHAADRRANHPHRKQPRMKKEMLINVSQPEECRIAIVEDGLLEELYIERSQPGQLRRQHLQGKGRQSGAEHPGRVRRLRRRPQRLPAHQRRRTAVLPPGRLRSGQADPSGGDRRRPRAATSDGDEDDAATARRDAAASARRPAPHQTAHPGDLPPRRRSARPGHQGRDRHQRARRSRPTSAFPAATSC